MTVPTISVEALHGRLIACASLVNSLVRVLPIEQLRELEQELTDDSEYGRGFLLTQPCPDRTIDAYDAYAQAHLRVVRHAIQARQEPPTPGDDPL